MKIDRIAIIGLGALGMLFGDMLTNALGQDNVAFIADDARRARYEGARFTVNSRPCHFRLAGVQADAPADLVLFATKATGLDQAMRDAAGHIGPNTVLMSLLNGITSEQLLEARFGGSRVVHCVAQGMDAVKLGSALTYSQPGMLCVGTPHADRRHLVDAVCALLARANVPFCRDEDIIHRMWSKFMLNVGVNQVVMACEGNYGTIQQPGPERERMIAAMREVIALSEYEGAKVTEADLLYYLDLLDTLSPEGMPSMRQDGLARRRSEVDLFAGTVCRLSRKHGLACPVNDALYREITEREAQY